MTTLTDSNCDGKISFSTQKEANAAAVLAEHQRGVKLKSYHCKHCKLWHLTSAYS